MVRTIGRVLASLQRGIVLIVVLGMLVLNAASFVFEPLAELMSDAVRALRLKPVVLSPAQVAELRAANGRLAERLGAAENALEQVKLNLNDAKRARQSAEKVAEAAERKADEAAEALSGARRAKDEALGSLTAAKHSADELTEKIAVRVRLGATRNIAAMPFESLL